MERTEFSMRREEQIVNSKKRKKLEINNFFQNFRNKIEIIYRHI